MPNVAPVHEPNKEADAVVAKLVEMYPDLFQDVDTDMIACVQIVNKDKPEKAEWNAKIYGITAPCLQFSEKAYVIEFFKNTWTNFSSAQRTMMLFEQLLRIPAEMDGTLLKEDLKGFRLLIKNFGVDFIKNPKLPDLSKEKQVLVVDKPEPKKEEK